MENPIIPDSPEEFNLGKRAFDMIYHQGDFDPLREKIIKDLWAAFVLRGKWYKTTIEPGDKLHEAT